MVNTKKTKTTSKPTRKKVTVKKKTEAKPKIKKVKKIKTKFVDAAFNISEHVLVPKHTILSEKEKEKLFETYHITIKELPKILLTDPGIKALKPKIGDVVKIERDSLTAGKSVFYRGVINE